MNGVDLRDPRLTAAEVVAALGLAPHPEGGHYRETWRAPDCEGARGAGTAILFLLAAGERSHWHRVDADEIWIWQAGAPLALDLADPAPRRLILGPHAGSGPDAQLLQGLAPRFSWQAARSLGGWTLVTCTVSPAFRFEGFELAPPGWQPPGWPPLPQDDAPA